MSHAKPSVAEPSSKRAKVDAAASSSDSAAAPFVNPSDWPAAGAIDLASADLPHDSADTEWWYVNGHVVDPNTKHDLSFFASFFRICKAKHADGTLSVNNTHRAQQAHSGRGERVWWGQRDPRHTKQRLALRMERPQSASR
jgi:predicted secreted hydrolase